MTISSNLRDVLHGLFGCSLETAGVIAGRAAARAYPPRAAIVRQGEICGDTYLLIAGQARATLVTPDGRQLRLHDHAVGDLFGAIDAPADRAQPADISALTAVQTAQFRASDFVALVETQACVGLLLSRSLVRRLGWVTDKLLERSTLSVAGRVHAELLRLASDDNAIRPAPVLAEIAHRVQSSRETVSRIVNALERRGLIRRDADALFLVAPHRLQDMIY